MDILLRSDSIFRATGEELLDGYVLIRGNRIAEVGTADEAMKYKSIAKEYDLRGRLITPGFTDNHVFFSGYMLQHLGFDASSAKSSEELLTLIEQEADKTPIHKAILGHGLNMEFEYDTELLEDCFPTRPVMVFDDDREYCFMNHCAEKQYGFTGDECWAENCWRLFKDLLSDRDAASDWYDRFQQLLAERGVTSIKEIGFDHYDGFYEVLKEKEATGQLIHRTYLVSQPVRSDADMEYGEFAREYFQGERVKFMGFNLMVDGDIESCEGDLLEGYAEGYEDESSVDYKKLEQTVLEADSKGFRVALHAEGDRAVRKSIDIFEKCREVNSGRDARHAIVDMEMVHPDDLERLKRLDITGIQYIQIMNCYESRANYWDEDLLKDGQRDRIWAYRSYVDAGNRLCFGTDMPLDIPDIPASIKFGHFRMFPDGTPNGGYHPQEALDRVSIMNGWTIEGQIANFSEDRLGTLEVGKLADIAVIDRNILDESCAKPEEAQICMTIFDGQIVYERK